MLKIFKGLLIISLVLFSTQCFSINTHDIRQKIEDLLDKSNADTVFVYQKVKYVDEALKLSKQIDCNECMLKCQIQFGIIYLSINKYDLSHRYFNEALITAKETGNRKEEGSINYLLGNLFNYIKNYKEALKHYNEFIKINLEIKDTINYAFTLNSIGTVYIEQGILDTGKMYFEASLKIFKDLNYNFGISYPLSNLGSYYLQIEEYDTSLIYLNKVLILERALHNTKGISLVKCNIGLAYSGKRDYKNALKSFRECLEISEKFNFRKISYDCYKDISDMYETLGKVDSALVYYREYTSLKDSVLNREITDQISNYQAFNEIEKKERDLRESEDNIKLLKESQKVVRYRVWMLIIVIFAVSMIIFIRQRSQIISKQKILEKNNEVQKIKEELAREQIESQKKEKEIIEIQLSQKKKDLLNFGLDIARKNEFINELKTKISDKLNTNSEDYKKSMKELLFYVQNNDKINTDLSLFQKNVEKINEEFFSKLSSLYPSLSENEKNLCGMIRLGLSIKDIATVRNISPSSIEIARYRLRKKFNFNKGDDLSVFISNL